MYIYLHNNIHNISNIVVTLITVTSAVNIAFLNLQNIGRRIDQRLTMFIFYQLQVRIHGGVEGPPHIFFFDIMVSHTGDLVTRP